jgi:hypothetical protein
VKKGFEVSWEYMESLPPSTEALPLRKLDSCAASCSFGLLAVAWEESCGMDSDTGVTFEDGDESINYPTWPKSSQEMNTSRLPQPAVVPQNN